MLRCKNCGHTLTKFDKECCQYCGQKNPIEGNDDSSDTTQNIDKILEEDKSFKIKSFKTYLILLCVLGIFSFDLFYLGKKKEGLYRIGINCSFFVLLFLIIFLINNSLLVLAILLPLGSLFLCYLIVGLVYLVKKKHPQDSKGVYLR